MAPGDTLTYTLTVTNPALATAAATGVHLTDAIPATRTTGNRGVPVGVGGIVEYTLTIANSGNENADNVVVEGPVSTGSVFIGASASGSFDPARGVVTWTLGTLPVKYTNVGSLTLTDARVVDDVPLGTTFVSAASGGSFAAGGAFGRGTVTWPVPSLAGGASVTVTYRVVVDNPTNPANLTSSTRRQSSRHRWRTQPSPTGRSRVQPDAAPDPAAAAESNPDTAPTATSTPLPRQPRRWACPARP